MADLLNCQYLRIAAVNWKLKKSVLLQPGKEHKFSFLVSFFDNIENSHITTTTTKKKSLLHYALESGNTPVMKMNTPCQQDASKIIQLIQWSCDLMNDTPVLQDFTYSKANFSNYSSITWQPLQRFFKVFAFRPILSILYLDHFVDQRASLPVRWSMSKLTCTPHCRCTTTLFQKWSNLWITQPINNTFRFSRVLEMKTIRWKLIKVQWAISATTSSFL